MITSGLSLGRRLQKNSKARMLEIVHAILMVEGNYVMQWRDNKPTVIQANKWGLFGGSVEENEEPRVAMFREIEEELCIRVPKVKFLWEFDRKHESGRDSHYRIYESDITSLWGRHRLTEGQGVDCFPYKALNELEIPDFFCDVLARHHFETCS